MLSRAALVSFVLCAGCGADVDLGGSTDAGPADAIVLDGDAASLKCGDLVAPSVTAPCHACSQSSSDCQPNGCFNGFWCNVPAKDCESPPKTCP